jgi:hypothetical protein
MSAFLNGPISELVYVEHPPGFEHPKFPNHIYKLHEALYGLKQALRVWYGVCTDSSHRKKPSHSYSDRCCSDQRFMRYLGRRPHVCMAVSDDASGYLIVFSSHLINYNGVSF